MRKQWERLHSSRMYYGQLDEVESDAVIALWYLRVE